LDFLRRGALTLILGGDDSLVVVVLLDIGNCLFEMNEVRCKIAYDNDAC
jgi:hypothetical protein